MNACCAKDEFRVDSRVRIRAKARVRLSLLGGPAREWATVLGFLCVYEVLGEFRWKKY